MMKGDEQEYEQRKGFSITGKPMPTSALAEEIYIPVQHKQLDRPEWSLFRATANDSDGIGKILWKLSFRSFLS